MIPIPKKKVQTNRLDGKQDPFFQCIKTKQTNNKTKPHFSSKDKHQHRLRMEKGIPNKWN